MVITWGKRDRRRIKIIKRVKYMVTAKNLISLPEHIIEYIDVIS